MSIERTIVLWLACLAPPVEPWHEADGLETSSSVCTDPRCTTQNPSDASSTDVIVIDLDERAARPQQIDVGGGIIVELHPRESAIDDRPDPSLLYVMIEDPADEACEEPIPAEIEVRPIPADEPTRLTSDEPARLSEQFSAEIETEEELLPIVSDDEPLPLPSAETGRRDSLTADFQRAYAQLQAEGRRHEADSLAVQFLANDAQQWSAHPPANQPTPSTRVEHQVGYRSTPGRWVRTFPGSGGANWDDVAHRRLTARFDGTSIDELASFLRWATGLSVDVELPASLAESLRCHVLCNDASMSEALVSLSRQLGIVIEPQGDRLRMRLSASP